MAAILTSSIEIFRGPDEVFSYVADRSHDPEWIDSVVSAQREGAGPLGRGLQTPDDPAGRPSHGAVYRGAAGAGSSPDLGQPRLRWPTVVAKGGVEPLVDGRRSRLTISTQFQGHGIGKLLVPLLARRLTRQLPRDEQKLKQLLEQGTQAQT